jgi:hypothetical protein
MPALGFSGANLATVAYAEVDGAAGASTVTNSGVTTTRTASGTYAVVLPTTLGQDVSRDLIFVQAKANNDGSSFAIPRFATVDDSLTITKTVNIWSGNPAAVAATLIDGSFSILILRTTITPPTGAPA